MQVRRRNVIKIGGLAAVAVAGVSVPLAGVGAKSQISALRAANFPKPYAAQFAPPPVLAVRESTWEAEFRTDHYTVQERLGTADMVPGLRTEVGGYNGLVPGPTLQVDQGTPTVLRVRNRLPENADHAKGTATHLHGSASLPEYDGYADDMTPPGSYKEYKYANVQPARTLWYHDHGAHGTARAVYRGLAAQYHLHDPIERALLPQGEFDVPLTVGDAMFAADGNLAFDDRQTSGLWGDVILVNGRPWPLMKVKRRVYRFRFLNASLSRSYRPYLSTGRPVTMVATDGGLMPVAQPVTEWRHSPGERYEFLVDFSSYAPGTRITLGNKSNENNRDYDHTNKIMAFQVLADEVDRTDPTWNRIPTTLVASEAMDLQPAQSVRTRRMRLKHDDITNEWSIDGKTWQDVQDSGYSLNFAEPDLNSVEIWEIENSSGGWFHPVHIHLVDFKILSRNGRPPFPYERGPKDVVYVGEGETVRVIMRFGPHRGRYMIHCHNLPHEDNDMMLQYSVGLKGLDVDPHDPVTADPPRVDDLGEDA